MGRKVWRLGWQRSWKREDLDRVWNVCCYHEEFIKGNMTGDVNEDK